jgi:hypothetical protein
VSYQLGIESQVISPLMEINSPTSILSISLGYRTGHEEMLKSIVSVIHIFPGSELTLERRLG